MHIFLAMLLNEDHQLIEVSLVGQSLHHVCIKHKSNKFAVIIDEAHSGQSGRNSAQMNLALSGLASEDDMDNEDTF